MSFIALIIVATFKCSIAPLSPPFPCVGLHVCEYFHHYKMPLWAVLENFRDEFYLWTDIQRVEVPQTA